MPYVEVVLEAQGSILSHEKLFILRNGEVAFGWWTHLGLLFEGG